MSTVARCAVVIAVALALSALRAPVAVVPPVITLAPAAAPGGRRRPVRGASRDRSLPGKARVRARRRS